MNQAIDHQYAISAKAVPAHTQMLDGKIYLADSIPMWKTVVGMDRESISCD